jgi:hypothetical protein
MRDALLTINIDGDSQLIFSQKAKVGNSFVSNFRNLSFKARIADPLIVENKMATEVSLPDGRVPVSRRWLRYKLDVPIRLIAPKGNKISIIPGRGNELNEGGMEVFGGMELAIDEKVAIEFTPPYTGQPIRVRACVRNRRGYTYGVEFLLENDEDAENVAQIRAMLSALGSRI